MAPKVSSMNSRQHYVETASRTNNILVRPWNLIGGLFELLHQLLIHHREFLELSLEVRYVDLKDTF